MRAIEPALGLRFRRESSPCALRSSCRTCCAVLSMRSSLWKPCSSASLNTFGLMPRGLTPTATKPMGECELDSNMSASRLKYQAMRGYKALSATLMIFLGGQVFGFASEDLRLREVSSFALNAEFHLVR